MSVPARKKESAQKNVPAPTSTTRSSEGLRDTLFEEMDMLRAGHSTPLRASAVSKIAAQVIEAARLDLDFMRATSASKRASIPKVRLGR